MLTKPKILMGQEGPLGGARSANEVAEERSVLGTAGPLGRAYEGKGQHKEDPPQQESEYDKLKKNLIEDITKDIVANLAKTFPTIDETRAIFYDMTPSVLRNIGNAMPTGRYAMLGPSGSMMFADLEAGGGIVDFSLDDFGYEIGEENKVTISNGFISFDDVYAEITGDNFTITGTYYIWLDIDKVDPLTASLAGGADIPDDDEQHIYVPLYTFTASEDDPPGAATLTRRWHIGSFISQVPAWPAEETPRHVSWQKIVVCVDDVDQFMWVLGTEPFTEA
jgi:hypothetical protein